MSNHEVIIREDNDDVRICEYRLPVGAATGYHRHDFDYVVVPLTDGTVRAVNAGTEIIAEMVTGGAYFRKMGVEHDVINIGNAPLAFIEVELKRRQPDSN